MSTTVQPRCDELRAALGRLSSASRKTVNAALQRFEKSGWVKTAYRSVTITNLRGLSRYADGGRERT